MALIASGLCEPWPGTPAEALPDMPAPVRGGLNEKTASKKDVTLRHKGKENCAFVR